MATKRRSTKRALPAKEKVPVVPAKRKRQTLVTVSCNGVQYPELPLTLKENGQRPVATRVPYGVLEITPSPAVSAQAASGDRVKLLLDLPNGNTFAVTISGLQLAKNVPPAEPAARPGVDVAPDPAPQDVYNPRVQFYAEPIASDPSDVFYSEPDSEDDVVDNRQGDALGGTYKPQKIVDELEQSDSSQSRSHRGGRRVSRRRHHTRGNRVSVPEYVEEYSDPISEEDYEQEFFVAPARKSLWAQCERCLKWRRMPPHITDADLPDKWFCRMHPSPSLNHCSAPEEAPSE